MLSEPQYSECLHFVKALTVLNSGGGDPFLNINFRKVTIPKCYSYLHVTHVLVLSIPHCCRVLSTK